MPHLSRRDTQLLLAVLRRRSVPLDKGNPEEERLLHRLQERLEKSVESVREHRAAGKTALAVHATEASASGS